MRKVFTYMLMLFALNSMAQADYEISVLDSINNSTFNQGVLGLTAVEYGGVIHLSYFYGSQDANWSLIHETRNNGQQLSLEVAHDFGSNGIDRSSKTAIQFDENGQLYIYCAYRLPNQTKLSVFTKTDQWEKTDLNYTPLVYHVHSSGNGQVQPGFVTYHRYYNGSHYIYQVDYFEPVNGTWTQETVYSSKYTKTNPSCFHASNGESYISFVEGHHPDTTELFIFRRTSGDWTLDHNAVYENQTAFTGGFESYIAGVLYSYFGEYNGAVHLLHNMDNPAGTPAQPTHLEKTLNGWENRYITNPGDYPGTGRFNGSGLEFDAEGTLYWVDHYAAVRLIRPDQEYKAFEVPLEGPGVGYFDFVLIDDHLYMYYFTGDNAFPWGDELKFYEAGTDLTTVFTTVQEVGTSIDELNLYPNPGNGQYTLQVNARESVEMVLEWIDGSGRLMSRSNTFPLTTGIQTIELRPGLKTSGLYYLRVQVRGERPVLIPVFER